MFAPPPFEQKQQHYSNFAGAAVELAPYNWEAQVSNTPGPSPAKTPAALHTPLPSDLKNASASSIEQEAPVIAVPSKAGLRSTTIGFGLAGLCTTVGCLLLLFVYAIAQTLPHTNTPSSNRLTGGTTLVTQNTPVLTASPSSTVPTASPTLTFPGGQYIAHAQTANAVNVATAHATLPASSFRIGQKIYITFDVQPAGHTGAICLLWYINGSQFASYPFAINTITPTSAYSYAATTTVGTGYVEIYWETAPSCIDPAKLLGSRVDFTVTA